MKKIKLNQAAEKIGRSLVKKFRAEMKTKNIVSSSVYYNFGTRITATGIYIEWEDEYVFDDAPEHAIMSLSIDIWKYVREHLKVPRGWVWASDRDEKYARSSWDKYPYIKTIRLIRPCKAFLKASEKIAKITGSGINIKDWCVEEVTGKRSEIFFRNKNFRCLNERSCEELYDYIKRKKNFSVEYKTIEDCEDREYGIRYETEWSGRIYHDLVIVHDGKRKNF